MKRIFIFAALALLLIVFSRFVIVRDCGWIGIFNGMEWVWLLGKCG